MKPPSAPRPRPPSTPATRQALPVCRPSVVLLMGILLRREVGHVSPDSVGATQRPGQRREWSVMSGTEQPGALPQPARHTRLDSYVDLYATRTQAMKASEIRALFAVASRPEVVSLAGGMPNI